MVQVVFYEKPGCLGNRRQKADLTASGHDLEVRNLLAQRWSPARLRPCLGALPVPDWFNRAAPAVKSGQIDPDTLSAPDALETLCADPILIRRPLMSVCDSHRAGFDAEAVDRWIGLSAAHGDLSDGYPRSAAAPTG